MASGNDREIRIGVTAETSGAEEARKALEGVRRAAEEAAAASGEVRPLEGGAGGARVDARAIEEVTAATLEQVEANGILIDSLDELTDAEAGVVRSTGKVSEEFKKLSEEAKKPEGFAKLYSKERMEGIKSSFQDLGRAVGEFAKEFAKTDEGKRLLEGLPEELQVFGETALKVSDDVAKGFSQGGPIGGAVSGLAALIQHVGKEYLDAQERIKASNEELERAQAAHAEKAEARRKEAIRTDIEKQYQRELEILESQSEEMDRQRQVRSALRELQDEDFALNEEKERAAGASETDLKRKRIDYEATRDKEALDEEVKAGQKRMEEMKAAHEAALKKRDDIRTRGLGTGDAEYEEAQRQVNESNEQFIDSIRDVGALGKANGLKKAAIDRSAERQHLQLDREESGRKKREEDREAADKKQEDEKAARDGEQKARVRKSEEGRVRDIGHDADGISSKAAGIAEKRLGKGKGSEALDTIGAALSDDPTAKELESLTKLLTQLAGALDKKGGGDSRAIRDLQKEVRDLQGKLTKGGDAVHR